MVEAELPPYEPQAPWTPGELAVIDRIGAAGQGGPTREELLAPAPRRSGRGVFVHPAERHGVVGLLLVLLVSGVVFTQLLTLHDAVPARAYRTAATCAPSSVGADCRATVPMMVNGVRTSANGGEAVDVSLTDQDGSVNDWARFDAGPLTRQATRLQSDDTVLPAKVWRQRILAVQVDGVWDWAQGDPPEGTAAAIALSVVAGLLLALNRARARLRLGGRSRWAAARDDVLQLAGTAGGLWLLADGLAWAALLLTAALVWSLWSVRRAGVVRAGADAA
jgi:hypothetical protein